MKRLLAAVAALLTCSALAAERPWELTLGTKHAFLQVGVQDAAIEIECRFYGGYEERGQGVHRAHYSGGADLILSPTAHYGATVDLPMIQEWARVLIEYRDYEVAELAIPGASDRGLGLRVRVPTYNFGNLWSQFVAHCEKD